MARKIPSIDETTKAFTPEVVTANSGTTSATFAGGADSRITGAAQKASNLSDLANAATARTNLGLGTAATTDATAYVLPAASGVDDTAAMQATLTAHAGRRIVGRPGAAYIISAPLVIASGTTLDVTGCTITLKIASNCRMIQNAALGGAGARDVDITLLGGTWDRGANVGTGNNLHSIVFHRVDGLTISGITYTSTNGKYGVLIGDAARFAVSDCHFASYSDGVHIQGPASSGVVRDLYGTTGDDMVAITCRDYPAYDLTPGGGDVSDVVIDGVFPEGCKAGGKVLAGLGRTARRIVLSRFLGSTQQHGIRLGDDTAAPEMVGSTLVDITCRDINVSTGAGYAAVQISAEFGKSITLDGISTSAATTKAVLVTNQNGTSVETLTVRNVSTRALNTANLIDIAAATAVGALTISGVTAEMIANKSAGSLVNVAGAVNRLIMSDVIVNGGQNLIYMPDGGSCPAVYLSNIHAEQGYGVRNSTQFPTEVIVAGAYLTTTNGLVRASGTGSCAATIRGAGIRSTSVAVARSAAQPLRVVGAELRADTGLLTPQAGDLVYNTDASEPQGAGLSIYTGSAWKNLQA